MAKNLNIPHVEMVEKETARESRLFADLSDSRLSPVKLRQVIRSLLMCRTRRDREVVALHVCQGLPIAQVAVELEITPGQVRDTIASINQRAILWERFRQVEDIIRKNTTPHSQKRARRKTVTPSKAVEGI
jgi:hypothetical protein